MKKLFTYECILPFRSTALNKTFKPGDQVKAPSSLGINWIKLKTAKLLKP